MDSLKLHNLRGKPGARVKRLRVGRGESSGVGKTSGRGGKGQTARSGGGVRPGFEGGQMPLYRRLPKVGFTSRRRVRGDNVFELVRLDLLNSVADGAVLDAAAIKELGYAKRLSRRKGVKVLAGSTPLSKRVTLKVNAISDGARAQVEKAGGSVEIIAE